MIVASVTERNLFFKIFIYAIN